MYAWLLADPKPLIEPLPCAGKPCLFRLPAKIATELVRQGYVVVIIDMFYWGERRMLLDNDPADWRERPASSGP